MRSKPYKLVAIDLDGTTVADSEDNYSEDASVEAVFPGTVEAALAYQQAGGRLVIATGRGYHGAKRMAAMLQLEKHTGLMVCGNGATVHDLNAADPSASIADRETLRADTLSTLYRTILKHLPEFQCSIKCGGVNEFMCNAPAEESMFRFTRAAMGDAQFAQTSSFTYKHTLGPEKFCSWLDESYDQSLVTPDSIFAWSFGLNKDALSEALRPAFDEFAELTGQACHVAYLSMMSTEDTDGGFLTIDDGLDDITSKATGLKVVCEMVGLSAEDVLTIGNDTNDIEMCAAAARHCRDFNLHLSSAAR